MQAPTHPNEEARIGRLHAIGILDTSREQRFERIVFTAAQITKVPIAKINFIDRERQWAKAFVGTTMQECPRATAFCSHTILQNDVLIVEDARVDPRFADNPLVIQDPFVRFYAGVPLFSSDGLPLGSLCVVDRQPRRLTLEQIRVLKLLAREVEDMFHPMELDIAV